MIVVRNLFKSYQMGDVVLPILKSVSLDIEEGEFVAIMGSSGSGKSTLLNIIGCLDSPDSGSYRLGGGNVESASSDVLADIRRLRLGFVFQTFNLLPKINAFRNVELPMIYAGASKAERMDKAHAALRQVGLEDRAQHLPSQLSGGQQQRIAIARALVNDPEVLIADEPTGSLDSAVGQEILNILRSLHSSGKTIVMVTHDQEIANHASRVVRLRDGQIVSEAPQ